MPAKPASWQALFRREHSGFPTRLINDSIRLASKEFFFTDKQFYDFAQRKFMSMLDDYY